MNAAGERDPRIGTLLAGKYEIVRLLGEGGMGAVYEARHRFTQRRVAIKMLHAHTAGTKDAAARFFQEAQAPSSIRHPGIAEVLDAGTDTDGALYIAMEFLDGEDLSGVMARGPIDPLLVARVAWQILDALEAAHRHGFVHRDIKPQNIFLARDERDVARARLVDFGIARQADATSAVHLTNTGAILGTPMYMSPEQARGERVDGRSDLWSLGATMFHALTGRGPFVGANYNLLIIAIVTTAPASIDALRPDLPVALRDVIRRALEPDLANRWPDARAMATALEAIEGVLTPIEFAFARPRLTDPPRGPVTPLAATPAEALLPTLASYETPPPITPSANRSAEMIAPTREATSAGTPLAWGRDSHDAARVNAVAVPGDGTPIAANPPSRARWYIGVPALLLCAGIAGFALRSRTPPTAPVVPSVDASEVPHPIAPASLAVVAPHRPAFRWTRPRGVEAVSLEVCRDRACRDVVARTYVSGDSGTLDRDLEPGRWYWRLRGLSQGRSAERTSATWLFTVRPGSAIHATSANTIGDVDGDGIADVIIAAPRAETSLGGVLLYRSSARGIAGQPVALLGVDGANGRFGAALTTVGDVDGDGLADLVVGAPETFLRSGRAYVFAGRTGEWSASRVHLVRGIDEPESFFGAAIAALGDTNGDGFADIAIAQWGASEQAGRVLVFNGSAQGLSETPTVTLQGSNGDAEAFGASIAGAGDVNGDGFADLVVGAAAASNHAGRAYVFLGGAAGIASDAARVIEPVDAGDGAFGDSVASAGDVNGDGFADVAIAAPRANGGSGRVHVYLGSTFGLGARPVATLAPPDASADGAHFGSAIAAGDVNGDGFDDVVIGADRVASRAGAAFVYFGSAAAPPILQATPNATLRAGDDAGGAARFGASVSVVGDLDADGHGEIVVGAPDAHAGAGAAYVFGGTTLATPTELTAPRWPDARFGDAIAR